MELILLKAFAFFRPLLSIEVEQKLAGMSLFDLAGIALIGILTLAFCVRIALVKSDVALRAIDVWMLAYVFWCVAISLIYMDTTDYREVVKWTTPFIAYLVAAKILRGPEDYLRVLLFLLVGHILPILASAVVIFLELDWGIRKFVGATDLAKFEGVYANSGNLGLGMTLFLIAGVIYAEVARSVGGGSGRIAKWQVVLFGVIAMVAFYCLIKSQSRTAQVGLIVFFAVYLYQINKKWLLFGAATLSVFVLLAAPVLKLMYYDVIEVHQGERPLEELGSNRPTTWAHNLSEFSGMSLDRQLAGAGIGNIVTMGDFAQDGGESFWSSHNDFLAVLIHTGIVGIAIFVALQIAILKKILAIEGGERRAFFALFVAVTAMNFASNSYLSRYALAQMYLVILAYLEFAAARRPTATSQPLQAALRASRTQATPASPAHSGLWSGNVASRR